MNRFLTTTLLLIPMSLATLADTDVEEHRYHSRLADASGAILAETTTILLWGETSDRTVILYRSALGDELVFEDSTDYEKRTMEWTIRTVRGDAWVTQRAEGPLYVARTREGVLKEFRERMDAGDLTPFTNLRNEAEIETNGGKWRVLEDEFEGEKKLRITMSVRPTVPFHLLEMIERAADGFLSDTEDAIIPSMGHAVAKFVLYETHCPKKGLTYDEVVPDCDFDESFGFPCSDEQNAQVKKLQEKEHEWLRY